MPADPRPLLRFVQLRRLTDAAPGDGTACTTGPTVVGPCFDFRDDWSPEVREAVTAGNRERGRALYRERRDALDGAGREAARLALALLRLATVNQRLTVGELRARVKAWPQRSRPAVADAATWATDMLTLRRWLQPKAALASSQPGRVLRGVVLVRLAGSKAEDACRVRALIVGHTVHLPPLPRPKPVEDPLRRRADQLAALRRDLARMRTRTRAVSRTSDPTLGELRAAAFPDLAKSMEALTDAATALGLSAETKASAVQRVLDGEYAETRRSSEARAYEIQSGTIDLDDIDSVLDHIPNDLLSPSLPALSADVRVLGRGDLMVIRTSHLRYDVSDISHIENVLASEVRERTHVIDTSTSETVTTSTQTLAETTQDLETTEQNSLERATASAATRTSAMSLGVSVSGGFGPVQAGIDIGASSSTSTSTSVSSAVSYSKTITERASETLRSEAAYRRTTTSRTRVTETNLHKFDNAAGAANIAGIYRWVDKVDQAQLYNYGERLLLEFFVPEPAAQFVYLKQAGEAEAELEPPAEWLFELEELTEGNYVNKAGRWDVVGLEPPPVEEIFASASFVDPAARPFDYSANSTDKSQPEWGYSSYVGEVGVPDGYAASVAYVTVTWALEEGEYEAKEGSPPQAVQIAVGEDRVTMNDTDDGETTVSLDHTTIGGPLPIGISTDQRGGLTVVVRVRCERTDAAYEAWRLRTYETIRAGYLAQLDAYETELRLRQTRQAYASTASPGASRLIEMQELKRGCQTILSGQDFDLFGAVTFPADDIPRVDLGEARAEADYVQWFEDCIDWPNLTYLLYPYQWAGRERWAELQSRTSTDPLHQAFLQAGAARVVVPVREGYEHTVGRYLATSEIPTLEPEPWRGSPNPYPPIEELIADALERPGDEVAVGEPWEVVTPTALVYLQTGPELNPPA